MTAETEKAGSGDDSSGREETDVDQLLEELEELEDQVESPAARNQVRETMRIARRLERPGPFGRVIRGFDRRDATEALVGSVVFGIPMVIEGGTLEAGEFTAAHPLYLFGTLGFGIAMVVGLLYATDIQRVEIVDPLFGIIPRRVAAVVVIATLTAVAMMTAWGRVDWAAPWVAVNQIAIAFVGMAIGAALGDILPGS